jgi:hypothetical protein
MALLGVSLLTLPLFDGAVINFATAVPSVTAGSAIALLAVAQCVRPDYWQYLTEVLLGFAVTLTAIFTRPTLAQCDWQLLAMGVAVMILATISDGSTLKLIGMNIRQHGSMALKMHFFTLVACHARCGSSIPAPSSSVTREPKGPTPTSGCAPSRRIGASRVGRARSVVVPIAL